MPSKIQFSLPTAHKTGVRLHGTTWALGENTHVQTKHSGNKTVSKSASRNTWTKTQYICGKSTAGCESWWVTLQRQCLAPPTQIQQQHGLPQEQQPTHGISSTCISMKPQVQERQVAAPTSLPENSFGLSCNFVCDHIHTLLVTAR